VILMVEDNPRNLKVVRELPRLRSGDSV